MTEIQNIHEEAFIKIFIVKEKQERILALRQNRKKFRLLLAHNIELNKKFARLIKKEEDNEENIYQLLKKYGAADSCYIMCENSKFDVGELKLKKILHELFSKDFGFIISCIPGKLAYYHGEDSFNRIILLHPSLNV